MLKQAWRSYLASLHPRNYKKIKNGTFLGLWIYWLVISPIINDFDHSGEAAEQIWFYAVNLTPYPIMWWSNLEQKLSMPKQMYLLPMKAPQRAEYVRDLMMIKISFPALVGLILHVIRGLIYEFEPWRILVCTIAIISFGIGMYVCSSLRSKFDRYIRYAVRGEDGTGKDAFLNWMCMIYSAIYHFIASGVVAGPIENLLVNVIWEIVPLMIMIIMDIAIIKTRFLWTVVDICNYEEAFNVLGKVKK
ncbi:MAG: hypothetical protein IJ455_06460 [Agathobacter sp.]|nr:hypothetical protein [Agathobacter sp.]